MSVGPSFGPLVGNLCEKVTFRVSNGTSNCDKTEISNCDEIKNSNGEKTQKHKLWWNSKTQIVMKLKNSNCDATQKLKLCWNSTTQIVMKLRNSNGDKTPKLNLWQTKKNSNCVKTKQTKVVTKLKLCAELKLW